MSSRAVWSQFLPCRRLSLTAAKEQPPNVTPSLDATVRLQRCSGTMTDVLTWTTVSCSASRLTLQTRTSGTRPGDASPASRPALRPPA